MLERPESSGIFLLDLNAETPEPFNLPLEGFSSSFNPHGMSKWVGEDGSMYLYVINHGIDCDTVESFEYQPSKKTLVHQKTFQDSLFRNLNSLVVVDLDHFYVTVDRYYKHPILKEIETLARMAFAYILYFDGQKSMIASESLKYPNGIAMSRDRRLDTNI